MKRKIYLLLPFLLLAVVFTACDETKEAGKYDNWRSRNDAFIDSLQHVVDAKSDPELFTIIDETTQKNIYYKILEKGDATKDSPLFTSKVELYYRGMYINEAIFAAHPNEKYYTRLYKELDVFNDMMAGDDPNPELDELFSWNVDEQVSGFSTALMHMHPGDRWELYIPNYSAYLNSNKTGLTDIIKKATLIFDVNLVNVTLYPEIDK